MVASRFKQRFALWALGQALPETAALKSHLRAGMLGVVAASACGALVALMIAAGGAGLYFHTVEGGMEPSTAAAVVAGVSFVLALAAYFLARDGMNKSSEVAESLELFGDRGSRTMNDACNLMINGFIDGLLGDPAPPRKPAATPVEEDEKIIPLHFFRKVP